MSKNGRTKFLECYEEIKSDTLNLKEEMDVCCEWNIIKLKIILIVQSFIIKWINLVNF